jgi:hypothetical protein
MLSNPVQLLAILGLAAIIVVPTSSSPSSAQQGARQSHSARAQARFFNSNAAVNRRVSSRPRARSSQPRNSAGEWTAIHGAGGP